MNIKLTEKQEKKLRKMVGSRDGDVTIAQGPFADALPYAGRAFRVGRRSRRYGVIVGETWLRSWLQKRESL